VAKIVIDISEAALKLATKHAKQLGYADPADWAYELLRNFVAQREDQTGRRMHGGELNPIFGRSHREMADFQHRAAPKSKGIKI
jgi:hypothetical protein